MTEAIGRARAFLLARGATEEEIDRAEAEGRLQLLVADRAVIAQPERFTPVEVAELSGLDLALLRRLWRALGFREVADEEVSFSDADVDALTILSDVLAVGFADVETAVQLARVMGWSMMRVAEAELAASRGLVVAGSDAERTDMLAAAAETMLPALGQLVEYVWRRHFQAAIRRAMLVDEASLAAGRVTIAVGFVDLVGFTTLSQQLSEEALAELVTRFESVAHETITEAGGRVVKTIGDEVMFVVTDPAEAVHVGVELAESISADEGLSEVRVGIACGPVLLRDGDYYGPVVNLASRIVGIASPGSVVVSDEVHETAVDDPAVHWRSLRTRYLKDIGRVPLWSAQRATTASHPSSASAPSEEDQSERPSLLAMLTEAGREALERRARLLAEAAVQELDEREQERRS